MISNITTGILSEIYFQTNWSVRLNRNQRKNCCLSWDQSKHFKLSVLSLFCVFRFVSTIKILFWFSFDSYSKIFWILFLTKKVLRNSSTMKTEDMEMAIKVRTICSWYLIFISQLFEPKMRFEKLSWSYFVTIGIKFWIILKYSYYADLYWIQVFVNQLNQLYENCDTRWFTQFILSLNVIFFIEIVILLPLCFLNPNEIINFSRNLILFKLSYQVCFMRAHTMRK